VNFSKVIFVSSLMVLSVLFSQAHADDTVANEPPAASQQVDKSGLRFFLNGGLTYGGDTIFHLSYTNGDSTDIKAGSLVQFGMGGQYQFQNQPLVLLMSINYHIDNSTAKNGDASFKRMPIEVLAYYTGVERFRMGGGIRFVNSPEASATVNGYTEKITFDSTRGLVAEIGYQLESSRLESQAWLNFRLVSEQYQGNMLDSGGMKASLAGTPAISGNHIGVNFTYVF